MGISTIEWTDYTFNPWRGCEHATLADGTEHPGCAHCYAETMSKRNPNTLGTWGADGVRVVGTHEYWWQPLKWNSNASAAGVRKRVFCASLADVFEDWKGPIMSTGRQPIILNRDFRASDGTNRLTMDDLRRRLFKLIDATPWLDWLLLTKRPQNIRRMWPLDQAEPTPIFPGMPGPLGQPMPCVERRARTNVWLGTSVSDQATTDELFPQLYRSRRLAPVLFLSAEPLLGSIELGQWIHGIDWIIAGAESGRGARWMEGGWVRRLRDQCRDRVPFFYKQNVDAAGKKIPTPELDGKRWVEFPEPQAERTHA